MNARTARVQRIRQSNAPGPMNQRPARTNAERDAIESELGDPHYPQHSSPSEPADSNHHR